MLNGMNKSVCYRRKIGTMMKFQLQRKLLFMCVLLVFLFQYHSAYVIFLISRAWYNWVTLYYNSDVVEVNVIDINELQDVTSPERQKPEDVIPKGYLGYEKYS